MESMRAASFEVPVVAPVEARAVSEDKVSENSVSIETATENMPDSHAEFKGGQTAMISYLVNAIKYPEAAQNVGVEGTVVVGFTVNADGTLSDFKVVKSVSPELDAELSVLLRQCRMVACYSQRQNSGLQLCTARVVQAAGR